MMDCVIRRAVVADIEHLVPLLAVLFSMEEDFAFHAEKQQAGLLQMMQSESACVLVAEAEGQIVGMCTGQLTISTAEGGPAVLVEDVVIRAGFRGQGIGGKLMAEIAFWAQGRGASRLQLLADKTNEQALQFYHKLGLQATRLVCLRRTIAG